MSKDKERCIEYYELLRRISRAIEIIDNNNHNGLGYTYLDGLEHAKFILHEVTGITNEVNPIKKSEVR